MENQLHIQQMYNYSTKHIQEKNKVVNKIKDNLNFIYIVLMIIINTLFSLLKVEDGHIGLTYPHSVLGWVMWALNIFIKTLIGVLILGAFRRQGVKLGHDSIKDVYEHYLEVVRLYNTKRPRSLAEYMKKEAAKDSTQKAFFFAVVSIFVGSVVIGSDLNNLLSLIIDILFAVGFGIKTMLDAEEFVVTELVMWYQLKIAEVTDHKLEPAKEKTKNGISKQRVIRQPRPAESGRVQQAKKRRTGPKIIDLIKSSSTANRAGSSGISS